MKRYLIPLLVLCFIVFGITTGTSYAAESQATQSTNITATEEASQTASKEASSANIESTNKPLSLESSNVSHNEQATPSSETTTHPSVETSTTQNTTSEKHSNSSQGSAFSQEKATPEPATNDDNTSSQEKASSESTSNENNTSQFHGTEVKPSPSTSEQSKSTQVEPTKESTSTKVKQTPQEPTQQQQKRNVPESQQSTPASKQVSKNSNTTSEQAAPKSQHVTVNKRMAATSDNTNEHTILHTNDIHGRFVEDDGRVIGMAKVKGLKDKYNPDLMVDSGDAFQGLPVSNNSKGEEMAKAMNGVGYDAMTVGNHEFDFGYDQLLKLQKQLNFPIVSSNIYKNGKRVFDPSTTVTKNNVRYGIVGVTTPETKTKTSPTAVEGVEFKDPLTSVKQAMNEIKNNVDVFVILSHLGVDKSTQKTWRGDYLIDQLTKDGSFKQPIFVLDGHSHTVIDKGEHYGTNNVLAQTGTALANVGRVDFTFQNQKASDINASLINVADAKDITPDPQIDAQTKKANDDFLKETSTVVIPNNTVTLNGERAQARTQETNLGNLITDAMEAYASKNFSHQPDFAITNGGGIRASIEKGEVTENDIITVLPFGNLISQIQVKGSDVEKAFEHSLSADTETQDGKKVLGANGGFLQVSDSLRVYYDINKASGQRINAIKVLNKENGEYEDLDPNRTYYVTTNDFTANQGDGYDMFGGQREEGISLDAVVAQYIKNTDLNQYNTEEPVRIINGLPESNEQPDTSKEDNDNDNNHSTNGHDGQQQTPDSNNDDKDNTGHINDNEADSSNKDNVIEFPNKDHQKDNDNVIEIPANNNQTHNSTNDNIVIPSTTDKMHTNNIKGNAIEHHPTSNLVSISNNNKGTRNQLTGNASHSQHCKDVIKFPVQINPKDNFYNETLITTNSNASKNSNLMFTQQHGAITSLPNAGLKDGSLEHGIAIILVVAGTGLIYIRTRKKSA
ncbi:5'-nucleotidase C-terminal domain-containing protein [Staphylococcus haemolyticus]|uniref:5'-nucleotidase C-terminal domain-containing protein n=1 Tax=Staphylococcus haemolyticus TaxID=1283 RepID=UPI00069E116D|nr:5'-nucleotidase C-terminal domain-containing protein [Staphylococcus haemolyticus]MBK3946403.1 5'-nucleotidase C-terminal domain-containing protein [Staphylococcus haemolyticus]MCH4357901.1 5'-nucleotidase C-terminal domain-containing protein [Staphylococcus haemolyticus]MCH4367208.1 5'-nucleotidase C-terminal domain-containing protein [Staphylococcus haemolyticus]MCH4369554.1 5'-nucleotidase C-terminal domain-containing protein [Staphylococcus haemolyticus]MCH4378768.1 5'-nucleotidase C-te